MLAFATEFAVDGSRTTAEFLASIREWLLGSPHTSFEQADLADLEVSESWLRISVNVTGDFGNVTDVDRMLGCAEKIVGVGSV